MNKLYYRVALPKFPLKDGFVYPPTKVGYHLLGKDILNQEITSSLEALGLEVDFCVLFCRIGRNPAASRKNQGIIHSDITYRNGAWEDIFFGVNWELTDSISTLSWWKTSELPVLPPLPADNTDIDDKLRGIHFGSRNNLSPIDERYTLIDSVAITANDPIIVNTNVPHSVDYFGQPKDRWALSIRFKNSVSSWDESLKFFKDIIHE